MFVLGFIVRPNYETNDPGKLLFNIRESKSGLNMNGAILGDTKYIIEVFIKWLYYDCIDLANSGNNWDSFCSTRSMNLDYWCSMSPIGLPLGTRRDGN